MKKRKSDMKKSNVLKTVLFFLLIVGVVGATAALTKGFTEFPKIVLSETEEQTEHHVSEDTVNSDPNIQYQDIKDIEDYEIKLVSKFGNGKTSGNMSELSNGSGYFYTFSMVRDEQTYWGINIKFLLSNGSFKKLDYGFKESQNGSQDPAIPFSTENKGSNHLVIFSYDGTAPNIDNKFEDDFVIDSEYKLEFGFKIFTYICTEPQFKYENVSINLYNDNYSRTKSLDYIDHRDGERIFVFNGVSNETILNYNISIDTIYSYNVSYQHDFINNILSLDKSYEIIVFSYSNYLNESEITSYDEIIDSITFEDGDYKTNIWIYGNVNHSSDAPEAGRYKISLSKSTLLSTPVVPPRVGNCYDLIIDAADYPEYSLEEIEILRSDDTEYDYWSGEIVDSELYIEIDPSSSHFGFGGFNFYDASLLEVPEDDDYLINIYLTIKTTGQKEAFTDLFMNNYQKLNSKNLSKGVYKISLTRDQLYENADENGDTTLIDELGLISTKFWLISAKSSYGGQQIDYWGYGVDFCNEYTEFANSLTISTATLYHSDEICIDCGDYDYLLDGFVAPFNINYLFEIIIKIDTVGSQDNFANVLKNNCSKNLGSTREFLKVTDINQLQVGDKILIGSQNKKWNEGGAVFDPVKNTFRYCDTTHNFINETNYQYAGCLLEVNTKNNLNNNITFKLAGYNDYTENRYLSLDSLTNRHPVLSSEPQIFTFTQNTLIYDINNCLISTSVGALAVTFSSLAFDSATVPDYAVNIYKFENNLLEKELVVETTTGENFENNREYIIHPSIYISIDDNISRLTQSGCLTWRKRSKSDFGLIDIETNLDSFEIVENNDPKYFQCKKGGSSVVEKTRILMEDYQNANFYITVEFNSSYTKGGYNQNTAYQFLYGYLL